MQTEDKSSRRKDQDIFNSSIECGGNGYALKKDVVLFVIKRSILESGIEAFELFNRSLFEKYHCEISDCFEKPEYLVDVLKYVYDGSYVIVVQSIKESLDKFMEEKTIKEFVEKIS
ncbi:MAG TPA: hypothetical protein VLD38_05295 [Nitrosopumilaceae archaeon]|nr:hypothetical protein [Nitrosopumilaceae archaeon]